jgi:hypothetical protein
MAAEQKQKLEQQPGTSQIPFKMDADDEIIY